MDKDSLRNLRLELKHKLRHDRRELIDGSLSARCPWCEKALLHEAGDMHEAIVSRRDVQGNKRLLPLIMQPANCVLVHHYVCHIAADTEQGKIKMIKYLIKQEGLSNILSFLHELQTEMITDLPAVNIRLVQSISEEDHD